MEAGERVWVFGEGWRRVGEEERLGACGVMCCPSPALLLDSVFIFECLRLLLIFFSIDSLLLSD